MTSVGDYLRGYVVGYWQAWDFATSAEGRKEIASADGVAVATSAATSTTGRSAPAGPQGGPMPVVDSAAEALPAVRQPALADEEKVEIEGDLAALHYHHGCVDALNRMASWLRVLNFVEAADICGAAAMTWGTPEDREEAE